MNSVSNAFLVRMLALAVVVLLSGACTEVDLGGPAGARYRIQSVWDPGQSFRVILLDPAAVDEAERLMASDEQRWVVGRLRRGDGGFNQPWSWHLDPQGPDGIHFAEITIEECQATAHYIEENLDAWLTRQNLTCIGGVVAERER